MAIYSWGWRICFFLAWRSGDAAGQRPLFSIFMTTYFLVWIQRGFVSISLCSEMWSYFRLEFLSLPFIAHHLVLQCVFHLGFWFKRKKKQQDLLFLLNSCLLCMEARPSFYCSQGQMTGQFCWTCLTVLCSYPVWSFALPEAVLVGRDRLSLH